MARIAGVDLPKNKRIEVAIRYIYGIGPMLGSKILSQASVNPDTRVSDLTAEEATRLREVISKGYRVEGDLRKVVDLNIKRLIEIGCYRGIRHRRGLPLRGQRTRTNARTKKGPRKTVAGRGQKRGATKK
ncbi:30S ribosomal protein S13 [Chloroflexota bacterium]